MTEEKKIKLAIFFILVALFMVFYAYDKYRLQEKLRQCSIYTVAKPTRTFRLRGKFRLEYIYIINGEKFIMDDPANIYDTGGSWWERNKEELMRRRYWIQVWCEDYRKHKILWDLDVPDSLVTIPGLGWKELPAGLPAYHHPDE
ncbi:hypothetical protein [Telluribacter humicola]|uniref:hypothetical protein n=1 Tax=Telluribacter humicola TaxID=1720261 RepID=UPI001A9791FD|nr:hypothetical protein [Telluribacter humicola]